MPGRYEDSHEEFLKRMRDTIMRERGEEPPPEPEPEEEEEPEEDLTAITRECVTCTWEESVTVDRSAPDWIEVLGEAFCPEHGREATRTAIGPPAKKAPPPPPFHKGGKIRWTCAVCNAELTASPGAPTRWFGDRGPHTLVASRIQARILGIDERVFCSKHAHFAGDLVASIRRRP